MDQIKILEEVKAFLAGSGFPWAVCGGFALDMFLDQNIRIHGDMDICVFEDDRENVLKFILDQGWQVYEFRGQGKVRPLTHAMQSDPGRNLMCLTDGCDIVKFYPCKDKGMLYHQFFHTGMKKLHYLEFLFNRADSGYLVLNQEKGVRRELSKAFLTWNGIPYLAPEIALLYKASSSDNPDYQLDYRQVYPHLNSDQREWYIHAMNLLYPDGHAWIPQAASASKIASGRE